MSAFSRSIWSYNARLIISSLTGHITTRFIRLMPVTCPTLLRISMTCCSTWCTELPQHQLDSGTLENLAGHLFRFKALPGEIARSPAVFLVIGIDLVDGLGDFA